MDGSDVCSAHSSPQLNKRAKIHNTDSIGNMTYNGQIMCDEQIGQTHLMLHVFEHVDYL